MSQALLHTKLYRPPPRSLLVSRPHLIDKLNTGLGASDQGFAGKVSLVSAPPGFGKTTVVSAWLDQLPGEYGLAWLSLDAGDDDPRRFLIYLIGAIQTVFPHVGQELVSASQLPPLDLGVEILVHELAAEVERLILVLDDYHVLTSRAISQAVAFLFEHVPANVHLVIIGRADPPFSLSRLRIRRQLTEIRAHDLRFTLDEASDFLNQTMGLRLKPAEIALLESRTEGWVAGLQLAAHSLQYEEDRSRFLAAFAGDDRFVADYLVEEVLARQSEAVQSFLLRTSILDSLNARLCDALLEREDSQATLAYLERSNLFVFPLDNRRQWYRYHHLFAELLRERLEMSPDDVIPLHRRAYHWYAENGLIAKAIDHTLQAADYDQAIAFMLANVTQIFQDSELPTLLRWWAQIPQDTTARDPSACMMAAWAWLATGHPQESELCLQAIEQFLGETVSALTTDIGALEPGVRNGLIEVAAVRISRQAATGLDANETLTLCRNILPYLVPDEQRYLFSPLFILRPVALYNIGLAYQVLGQLSEAQAAFEETIELGTSLRNPHLVAGALGHLAEVQVINGFLHRAAETCHRGIELLESLAGKTSPSSGVLHVRLGQLAYEWDDLPAAVRHLSEGVRIAKPWQNREALLPGYLGLIRSYRALRLEQESRDAEEALQELLSPEPVPAASFAAAEYALLQAEQGKMATANRWLDSFSPELALPQHEAEAMLATQMLLLRNANEEAARRLEQLLPDATAEGRGGRLIPLLVLRARCLDALGFRDAAQEALSQAVQLAESQGYVRTFVDGGPSVARLLHALAEEPVAPRHAYRLLQAFRHHEAAAAVPEARSARQDPSSLPSDALEPLSERELEVLRLISEGLTNKEIAGRLHLAVGTVKVHAHNIYGKLGVGGRTQAIAEARRLNLLP